MRLHEQSRDRSNLIEIIHIIILNNNFLLIICHLTYSNFSAKFLNQSFESIYIINLLKRDALLTGGTSLFQT